MQWRNQVGRKLKMLAIEQINAMGGVLGGRSRLFRQKMGASDWPTFAENPPVY